MWYHNAGEGSWTIFHRNKNQTGSLLFGSISPSTSLGIIVINFPSSAFPTYIFLSPWKFQYKHVRSNEPTICPTFSGLSIRHRQITKKDMPKAKGRTHQVYTHFSVCNNEERGAGPERETIDHAVPEFLQRTNISIQKEKIHSNLNRNWWEK